MADGLNWLFSGNVPGSVSTPTTTSTSEMPAWLQDFSRGLMAKSIDIASQPYTPYQGQRLAGFTPEQEQAFRMTQERQAYDPGQLQQLMNPFTQGAVQEMGRLGARQFQEQILPEATSSWTGAGQFGSRRAMEAIGRTARDFATDLAGRQGQMLQQAYQTALPMAVGQRQRDISALEAIGRQRQAQGQGALDIAYQDFMRQRDYPQQQLGWLSNVIRGVPMQQQQVATGVPSYTPSMQTVSPLSQALQAGTGTLGWLNQLQGVG